MVSRAHALSVLGIQGPQVRQEALAIAMNYLECTRQADPYSQTERICVYAIYNELKTGRRGRIWLSNKAIVAIVNPAIAAWRFVD
jgi:hypothetical protein